MRTTTVDLEQRQYDAVKSMAENGDAPNQSEAIRDAIERHAEELGYRNGQKRDTHLRAVFTRLAWAFIYAGVGAVGVLFFFPVGFRAIAVVPFLCGLVCLMAEKVLAQHEPRVSNRLRRVFRQGEKA